MSEDTISLVNDIHTRENVRVWNIDIKKDPISTEHYINQWINDFKNIQPGELMIEQQIVIRFKALHDDAVLPRYAKPGDAGMDCVTVSDPIHKGDYIAYDLGFAMEIPRGYVGLMFPRSSNSKKDLLLANSVGVIDSGYRGELQARFKKTHDDAYKYYAKGDAVCQLIVVPYPTIRPQWADELTDTERGEDGFGSSGH